MRQRPMVAERDAQRSGEVRNNCGDADCAPLERTGDEHRECAEMNDSESEAIDPAPSEVGHDALAVARARGEAVAAVDRFIATGLERDFGDAAALATCSLEHLATGTAAATAAATTATAGLAGRATVGTATRLVRKTFACVELLFVRGEWESASAIDAGEHFIGIHSRLLLDAARVCSAWGWVDPQERVAAAPEAKEPQNRA